MPVFFASNIGYQFNNGQQLFLDISCSMNKQRVGLTGRNGSGKSLLSSILCGENQPTSGSVTPPASYGLFNQHGAQTVSPNCSIARYLGKEHQLYALRQIALGSCDEKWFEQVNDQWQLESQLKQQLEQMNLPPDPELNCTLLSGGQLACLQLYKLFESDVDLLLLDEPSNHLDSDARQWLIDRIQAYKGAILLISHDRQLLRQMEEIWELSELGLKVYGGNYDMYAMQKQAEQNAVERQLANINKQKKQLEQQSQKSRERAEQRASQGRKQRKSGSRPKILTDGKKQGAENRAANRNKNDQLRKSHLQQKEQLLRQRHQQLKRQSLHLASAESCSRKAISMLNGVLCFGCQAPLTFQLRNNEKVHLTGSNGSGKSTLLKTLTGDLALLQGEVTVNIPVYYLDQHFSVVYQHYSLLENMMQHCQDMPEKEARTLLAGIGFRREHVSRLSGQLSGGEKMKLAMLIASHQPGNPLLLLDEPDNHLDLQSKQILAEALRNYPSGFVLISHDEEFAIESAVAREIRLNSCVYAPNPQSLRDKID